MEKESRKGKIMERGSDRMALITGRVHSLDTNNDQDHHNHPPQQDNLNQGEDEASGIPSKHSNVDKVTEENEFGYGSRGPENQILAEAAQAFAATFKNEIQSALDTESVSEASDDASLPSESRANSFGYFTPKRINSCILSSENTRVFCSMMIALLVVFSNINLPRNIVKSKSIISSRPLYVLLLTDVSIVVARLILWKRRGKNKFKKGEKSRLQDPDNWDGAVKLLELGLVLYQTIRAIFIDCSFYMVIVICGLSLV